MHTFICPRCQKTSYSSGEECFSPCPHCGLNFSGKYGADRRQGNRVRQEIPFDFFYQKWQFEACARDTSEKGLCINIFGNPPITKGKTIDLSIGGLQLRAEVTWVKRMPDKCVVGLKKA